MNNLLITGFAGMNNVQDKRRLKGPTVNAPEVPAECREIVNADISDTLSSRLRPGRSLALAGNPYSLWATPDESQAYFVDGSFKRLFAGTPYTAVSLRSLLAPSLPMSYTLINYVVVCSNGVDLFFVENGGIYEFNIISEILKSQIKGGMFRQLVESGAVTAFELAEMVFKETVLSGHILSNFHRSLNIAIGNMLYFTDPEDFQRLDERDDPFGFNGSISMVLPMENGMYVSADKTYWLAGRGPDDFVPRMACEGRAVEGSGKVIDGALLAETNFPIQDGTACIFTTTDGICVGNDQGQVFNLTSETLGFTAQSRGAALIRKQGAFNQYITWI